MKRIPSILVSLLLVGTAHAQTPDDLAIAIASNDAAKARVVQLLLAAGARKDKKGADGLAPLDRARKAGNQWAVEALTR